MDIDQRQRLVVVRRVQADDRFNHTQLRQALRLCRRVIPTLGHRGVPGGNKLEGDRPAINHRSRTTVVPDV
jgi:hypothetical protein